MRIEGCQLPKDHEGVQLHLGHNQRGNGANGMRAQAREYPALEMITEIAMKVTITMQRVMIDVMCPPQPLDVSETIPRPRRQSY